MPADRGPAAAEVLRFPRRSPPRPRPRPRPRLSRASLFASSAFLCCCILSCSSARRARSASLRRTALGLNLEVDPRVEDGAGVVLDTREVDGAAAASGVDSAVMIGTGAGPGGPPVFLVVVVGVGVVVVAVVIVVVAGAAELDSTAGSDAGAASPVASLSTPALVAAAPPRPVPPRPLPRPRVVVFGAISDRPAKARWADWKRPQTRRKKKKINGRSEAFLVARVG